MPASPPLDQTLPKSAATVHHAAQVDGQHPVELLSRGVQEPTRLADAGVVDDNVGDPVFGADPLGECLDRLGVGHVEHIGVRDATTCGDLGGGVLDGGLVDVADNDLCTLTSKGERGLAADSAARPGNRHQRVTEVPAGPSDLGA
ncbi:Uncharacterised protein [Mycobacterium tuberculosis]|nr:Uncharacterised protein [Mycobacterium tuberculosis]COZ30641.1 Uncharacterised protein [Mycobacterium tuberculosis]